MMVLDIKFTQNDNDILSCLQLRRTVFIEEQQVPESEEVDGEDNDCDHVLANFNKVSVGAARLKYYDSFVKVQRLCVLKESRGYGIGSGILNFIIEHVTKHNIRHTIRLGSQLHALVFYNQLGFIEFGDKYLDAGIWHKDMEYLT